MECQCMRRFMVLETYPTTRGGGFYTKKKMGMMREGVEVDVGVAQPVLYQYPS